MRNYTDEPVGEPAPPTQAPEPGTGVLYVQEDGEGTWRASWQAEDRIEEIEGVSEAEAHDWARSRQSQAALVFNTEVDDYRPL